MTALNYICWTLWIVGTLVIGASWMNVVTPTVGWIGFGIALVGSVISRFSPEPPMPPPAGPRNEFWKN